MTSDGVQPESTTTTAPSTTEPATTGSGAATTTSAPTTAPSSETTSTTTSTMTVIDPPPNPANTTPPSTTSTTAPRGRTADLADQGISVVLPPRWEGVIYRRDAGRIEFGDDVPRGRRLQPTTRAVVHLASFPLPEGRGDYGSGAVEIMRDGDVLVILFEFEPESADSAMFAADGLPQPIAPDDFDPNQLQRPLQGMAGVQRFFNVGRERSFCLFVVIGSYSRRAELTPIVNEVLAGIEIA